MSICRWSGLSPGSKRGNAAVEVGLLLPWIVFSFMAVLDFGCCAYGLIATQNAARAGAMWGAANSSNAGGGATLTSTACNYALAELKYAPGVSVSVTTCTGTSPIRVTATDMPTTGSDGGHSVKVSVTYTVALLAIPLMMPGSLAITRAVELPVRN